MEIAGYANKSSKYKVISLRNVTIGPGLGAKEHGCLADPDYVWRIILKRIRETGSDGKAWIDLAVGRLL